jgi:CubicO group peptidase (beta-lactamase class C family)
MDALPPAPLAPAFARLEGFVLEGLFPGAVLHVTRAGTVVGAHACGLARRSPDVPVDLETVFPLYSVTKPLVATGLLTAVDEGKLALDDPVARFVAGFERRGKGGITVRHLMTHTAGIPVSPGPDLHDFATSAAYAATLVDLEPYVAAGTRALYHGQTAYALLGEIFERATRTPLAVGVRERVLEPLGLRDTFFPVPPTAGARIAHAHVHPRDDEGARWAAAVNGATFRAAAHPAGGAFGTAADLARFLGCWLAGGAWDGRRVLQADTVREALRVQFPALREGVPPWPGMPPALLALDLGATTWGLGWRLRGDPPEPLFGFGAASPRAFGHAGLSSVLVFADPELALTFVLLTNATLAGGDALRVRTALSRAVVEASR